MFQFPRCPSYTYGFSIGCHFITSGRFPHSDTPGSQPAYGSPRHFGVRPVLRRHLAPRHPPCALTTLSYCLPMHGALRRHLPTFVRSRTYYVRSLAHLVGSLNHLCLVGIRLQIHFVSLRQTPHSFSHVPEVRSFTRSTVFLDLLVSPCLVAFGCRSTSYLVVRPFRSFGHVPEVRSFIHYTVFLDLLVSPCLLTDGFVRLASLQVVRCLCCSPCYVFGCQGSVNDRHTLSGAAILQN